MIWHVFCLTCTSCIDCKLCRCPYPQPAPTHPPAKKIKSIYVIGSMRNPRVPEIARTLREQGLDVFDDWYSPGEQTDDRWQEYEKQRGRTYKEALAGYHAQHAFALDKTHLDRCDAAVLVAPAGKSAHLELGYIVGRGKPGYILLDGEPERFDLMYLLATNVFTTLDDLLKEI